MATEILTQDKRSLETYFGKFREQIIGIDQYFEGPYGKKRILYADWIASGRMYQPIETIFQDSIYPLVANTHTETNTTGCTMTMAYHKARDIIKTHVNAGKDDMLISANSGMTGVINKLQRMLGFKVHEKHMSCINLTEAETPIVFITHMEHHSNQTSWLETIADVEIINADAAGLVDLNHFRTLLEKYKDRDTKVAAITSCSNVTGISTPYHEIAEMIHEYDGKCFVDFACSAPYIDIDMHPENANQSLDAIYFSPHKFLGGPSSSGILIFNECLYKNQIPDNPGGGTVEWTNPWGGHKYFDEIEAREDGGTPSFLQTMRVALSIQLKEAMGVDKIKAREAELIDMIWDDLIAQDNIHVLADGIKERLGAISFYIDDLHYNLGVKLLNDRYGIQVRGGCSCAGTYGHYLLAVSKESSEVITCSINDGDLSSKPGWIRLSLHPTLTNDELIFIKGAIIELAQNHEQWAKDYEYNSCSNDYAHKVFEDKTMNSVTEWFSILTD